jgi:alkyl hydroperoxide reductase subunit F
VFAAGDVTTVPFKQSIIAMREGTKASPGAFKCLISSSENLEEGAKTFAAVA